MGSPLTKLRNLRELRWRRKGPKLPPSVLDAAKLKIDPDSSGKWVLPADYRAFLSQMDGGRPGVQNFSDGEQEHQIEAFYTFADAANTAEKLRKQGKLPEGFLPVAMLPNKQPLVFVELEEEGQVWIRINPRARFNDEKAVFILADNFSDFLDLIGGEDDNSMTSPTSPNPWGEVTDDPPDTPKRKPKPRPKARPSAAKAEAFRNSPAGKRAAKKKAAKKKATKKKATKKKATKKKATKKKATKKKATKKKAAKKKATKKKKKKKKKKR
jgi:pyruvate/2-oxoglutarate dehydrogenase complex dihydrolipoamide acyltransferase (E2) component